MSRFSIPPELADDPQAVALHRRWLFQEIEQTLALAEIRSLSFDELLNRIENLTEVSGFSEIVFHVCECELSINQAYALAESVRRLAETVDQLPSVSKQTFDRAIRRILSRLPAEVVWPIAVPWLEHKRKFRREIAYATLRQTGIDEKAGSRLLEVFEKTGDQTALELIARNPPATRSLDVQYIMPLLKEQYWRMRLVEAVLMDDEPRAVVLAAEFPREFVHAVGRKKQKRLLPRLKELFDLQHDNIDFLSIYAWSLGQIGALEEIRRLREHIDQMKRLA